MLLTDSEAERHQSSGICSRHGTGNLQIHQRRDQICTASAAFGRSLHV